MFDSTLVRTHALHSHTPPSTKTQEERLRRELEAARTLRAARRAKAARDLKIQLEAESKARADEEERLRQKREKEKRDMEAAHAREMAELDAAMERSQFMRACELGAQIVPLTPINSHPRLSQSQKGRESDWRRWPNWMPPWRGHN